MHIVCLMITGVEVYNSMNYSKGIEFSIRTIAMIALGIMVIVLIYVSFEQWFTNIVDQFLGNIEYETP